MPDMVLCEICGEKAHKAKVISLDGTQLVVCNRCSDYGEYVGEYSKMHRTTPASRKRFTRVKEESAFELVPDYATRVHNAREKLGLTQEELGKKISEPHSVISRIESGKMIPPEKICRKLEKALGIEMEEKPSELEEEEQLPRKGDEEGKPLTLGDIVKLKKREL
jgi:putative transcription factor